MRLSIIATFDCLLSLSKALSVSRVVLFANMSTHQFVSRVADKKLQLEEKTDRPGARVRRQIAGPIFDPFLMIEEFQYNLPAGFPDHPHRGFETVTYILPTSKGVLKHEDFCGNKGTIAPGGIQWMTAGKGIVHSEMPGNEVAHGFQMWLNLAAQDKLCEAAYQDFTCSQLPKVTRDGVTATVIAGEALGAKSPVHTRTPTHYFHLMLEPRAELHQPIPEGWKAFIYIIEGAISVGPSSDRCLAHHIISLTPSGDGVTIRAIDEPASLVLLAGKPLNEPISFQGPFVMNTQKQIQEAMIDFQQGRNGFERAPGWRSQLVTASP